MSPEEQPTDAQLIARGRAGDEDAFRRLCERYAPRLRAQVRRQMPDRLRRRLSESDIVQETFLTAFERVQEFVGPHDDSFRRWLARIAELKVQEASRHHLRTAKRAAARELSRGRRADTQDFRGDRPSPSAQAMAGELGEAVDRALETLPDDYRAILYLVHEQGYALAAAAVRMNRSVAATRKLYGRALQRLAAKLEEEDDA